MGNSEKGRKNVFSIAGTNGAGIYAIDSKLDIDNAIIMNNEGLAGSMMPGNGNGIFLSYSQMNLRNSRIVGNVGKGCVGGGINIERSNGTKILNVVIEKNVASSGGGMVIEGLAELENVIIKENKAIGNGGGICFISDSLTLKNVSIFKNQSGKTGGGIYCDGSGEKIFFDNNKLCSVYLNKAINGGGDIFIDNVSHVNAMLDTFTVSNPSDYHLNPLEQISIKSNHSIFKATAFDLYVSPFGSNADSGISPGKSLRSINFALLKIISDSLRPTTIHIAPGIYSASTNNEDFPLFGRSFVSLVGANPNETILDGEHTTRLLHFYKVEKAAIKSLSIQNGYEDYGSGMLLELSKEIELEDLIISKNAGTIGGAITCNYSPAFFKSVLISENTSVSGCAGIKCYGTKVKLTNSSIVSNIALSNNIFENQSGGIFLASSPLYSLPAEVTLINSIIWNNQPYNIKLKYGPILTAAYSNIEGGTKGIEIIDTGTIQWLKRNIHTDPLFIGDEPFDYRLSKFSPCIDAGTAFFEWEGDTLLNLSADEYLGSAPDMGAFEFDPATGLESTEKMQTEFGIEQNYPNPFNAQTTITYHIPKPSRIKLAVYNTNGQLVDVLSNEQKPSGSYTTTWDGSRFSSGLYFFKLSSGHGTVVKKILLVK
jgi:predicted outer membrane repeat protein